MPPPAEDLDLPPPVSKPEAPAPRSASDPKQMLAAVDEEGKWIPASPLEELAIALDILAERRIVVRSSSHLPSVSVVLAGSEVELAAVPLGVGLLMLSGGPNAADAAKDVLRDGLDVISEAVSDGSSPDPKQIPKLEADGCTVRFDSFAQFVVQHRVNISHGAIVVASPALPPGTQRTLRLAIPGLAEPLTLSTRVAFQGDDAIGFMIDNFPSQRATLAETARRKPAAVSPEASRRAPLLKTVARVDQSLEQIFSFAKNRAQSPAEAKGWLTALLDHLFESRFRGRCVLTKGNKKLFLWLHDGCVATSRVEPAPESMLLGNRLIGEKKITPRALEAGLQKSKETGQPLGATLVKMGEIAPAVLDDSLRDQTIDRVLQVRDWMEAEVDVGPWVDPGVPIGLGMTSGRAVVASLLRAQVSSFPLEQLESFLEPRLDHTIRVRKNRVDPAFGITGNDKALLEQLSRTPRALRETIAMSSASIAECFEFMVLGGALGFVEFGAPLSAAEKTSEIERALDDQVRQLKESTAFEALGLHWSCLEDQIDATYQARIEELRDHLVSENERIRGLAERVGSLLQDAYVRLADGERRREYRAEVVAEAERKKVSQHMLDQVEALIRKADLPRAQAVLRCADEIFPSERGRALSAQLQS
jgi:hypothetical protein